MIHPYNRETIALWDKGELKVQVRVPNSERPVAYCDGTEADEAELVAIAESEGAESTDIHRKVLKTGREIWTMGDPSAKPKPEPEW
ncbi:MAG: hypothetical protein ACE366_27360 [Bradymonadia bacterium]